MELLLSKNPIFNFHYKTVKEYYGKLIESSDEFNIATGFVTNDSLVSLDTLLRYRQKKNHPIKINLLIGMDYLERFTRLQYDAIKELNAHITKDKLGKIMVSKEVFYHGKMYSIIEVSTNPNTEACNFFSIYSPGKYAQGILSGE